MLNRFLNYFNFNLRHYIMVTQRTWSILGFQVKLSPMEAFGHLSFLLLGRARDSVVPLCKHQTSQLRHFTQAHLYLGTGTFSRLSRFTQAHLRLGDGVMTVCLLYSCTYRAVPLGCAYLTRDLVSLRFYAMGGLSAAVVFQFFRPQPLWLPIKWWGRVRRLLPCHPSMRNPRPRLIGSLHSCI
jgi:hypothetical protein